jgi:hypothetical protein
MEWWVVAVAVQLSLAGFPVVLASSQGTLPDMG